MGGFLSETAAHFFFSFYRQMKKANTVIDIIIDINLSKLINALKKNYFWFLIVQGKFTENSKVLCKFLAHQ